MTIAESSNRATTVPASIHWFCRTSILPTEPDCRAGTSTVAAKSTTTSRTVMTSSLAVTNAAVSQQSDPKAETRNKFIGNVPPLLGTNGPRLRPRIARLKCGRNPSRAGLGFRRAVDRRAWVAPKGSTVKARRVVRRPDRGRRGRTVRAGLGTARRATIVSPRPLRRTRCESLDPHARRVVGEPTRRPPRSSVRRSLPTRGPPVAADDRVVVLSNAKRRHSPDDGLAAPDRFAPNQ